MIAVQAESRVLDACPTVALANASSAVARSRSAKASSMLGVRRRRRSVSIVEGGRFFFGSVCVIVCFGENLILGGFCWGIKKAERLRRSAWRLVGFPVLVLCFRSPVLAPSLGPSLARLDGVTLDRFAIGLLVFILCHRCSVFD